jgi:hypothetical protein
MNRGLKMRLFLPVRKHLLPYRASFVALDADREPGYGGGWVSAEPSGQPRNRAGYVMAGIVVLGIALIVFGPHRSTTQADQQQLKQQAGNGNAKAQLQLALDYRDGRLGLPVDHRIAANWLRQAAKNGNPDAEALLGDAYSRGDGVARDPVAAQRLWRQAAQAGDGHAEAELGSALLNAPTPAQQAEGQRWLNQAAAQGDASARAALGIDAAPGLPERNDKPGVLARLSTVLDDLTISGQSADNLEKRALAGDNVAQYQLAMHYRDGAWGVDADPKRALGWLRMAAGHGNPVAMTTLADAYDKGQFGLGMNPDQARYWRLRAAQASPPITHQPIVEK